MQNGGDDGGHGQYRFLRSLSNLQLYPELHYDQLLEWVAPAGRDGVANVAHFNVGGVGLPFACVRCKSREAVDAMALAVDPCDFANRCESKSQPPYGFYFYNCRDVEAAEGGGSEAYVRMVIAEGSAWVEDAATGSAAAAFAAMADQMKVKLPVVIHQGCKMGRPSLLLADTKTGSAQSGQTDLVCVSGRVRRVSSGVWCALGYADGTSN